VSTFDPQLAPARDLSRVLIMSGASAYLPPVLCRATGQCRGWGYWFTRWLNGSFSGSSIAALAGAISAVTFLALPPYGALATCDSSPSNSASGCW
jgi:hypothetical protein